MDGSRGNVNSFESSGGVEAWARERWNDGVESDGEIIECDMVVREGRGHW